MPRNDFQGDAAHYAHLAQHGEKAIPVQARQAAGPPSVPSHGSGGGFLRADEDGNLIFPEFSDGAIDAWG